MAIGAVMDLIYYEETYNIKPIIIGKVSDRAFQLRRVVHENEKGVFHHQLSKLFYQKRNILKVYGYICSTSSEVSELIVNIKKKLNTQNCGHPISSKKPIFTTHT
uniref:Uncharacterized protein n=1 Tax=Cacopsylla melanoneura TaxID=428564 RepID=A0A8D9E2X9_9HEMI